MAYFKMYFTVLFASCILLEKRTKADSQKERLIRIKSLLECVDQCIAEQTCKGVLYNSRNETCLNRDISSPPASMLYFKDYIIEQVEKHRKSIVQYKAHHPQKSQIHQKRTTLLAFPKRETIAAGKVSGCRSTDVELFHEACQDGDLAKVKRLVSQGVVDVNCKGEEEKTAVMLAAEEAQESVFDFLVQYKSDLAVIDENECNVLHYACTGGRANIVKKLLDDHKMETEVMNYDEEYPLMIALHLGHLPVVKLLLERGAEISPNEHRDSILHEACTGGDIDTVKYVLSLNVTDIDSRGGAGRTPLMCAAVYGNLEVLKFLKERGADIETEDDFNNNILIQACRHHRVNTITYLISLNIFDLECRGQEGRTPLMHNVRMGNNRIVKLLKKKGADMTALDDEDNNILHVACEGGHVAMVRYVLSLKVCDIEEREDSGRTPIMIAAYYGRTAVVKLLHKKQNASLTKFDNKGWCVLHLACKGGQLDVLRYLFTFKKLRRFKKRIGKDGSTPLQLAKEKGDTDIVKFLKSRNV